MTSFSTKAVSKIIKISPRQIDHWDRSNLIRPSISPASGYGSVRLYSFTDLVQFKVAKFLKDKGVSLQKLRRSLNYLRKHMPEIEKPLAQLRFLTDGNSIFVLTTDDRKIIDTVKGGQYVLSVAIAELIDELKGEISKLAMEKTYFVSISKRKFKVVLHHDLEDSGYWVECPELPGCSSQGDSIEEALDMIKDAIQGHLQVMKEEKKGRRRVA